MVVDTPGVNDLQNALTDNIIYKMQYDTMGELLRNSKQGVSAIVQCVMIGNNNRVKGSSLDILFKTMHSLTYTHPDYDPLKNEGPRICVIFTDFSKSKDLEDDICIEGSDIKDKFGEIIEKLKGELTNKIY